MQQNSNKGAERDGARENAAQNKPLSETIPNAHAAGDGAMERDKDTILDAQQEQQERKEERDAGKEAY